MRHGYRSELTYRDAFWGSVVIALFVALMTVIGEQDYRDAQREERNTCLMVAQGHWPAETAEGYQCPERVAGASHE